ncbi:MAG: DNA primase [Clostridiales bacterium]|nr:DNA primase [Eubacteriales bacterium]MDH7565307.1 DNA primase [Clostridiales bacterium]
MSNYYPEELIEEIRVNNDIVDVISEYVKLEKKGKDFFGLCPFHKEKTPSFSVAPAKQIFYCFGCGKGGDVIHFIMNVENLDYIEAVKLLADRARVTLSEGKGKEENEKANLRQAVIQVNRDAARFFYNELNSARGEEARDYLRKRKVGEQAIKKFGIGFAPHDWDSLYRHLQSKGYEEKVLIQSGLILNNKNGSYYDRFRGRIIFPIFDVRGKVIGFGGRVMDSSMPKYMNSPETLVYNKGKNLYALNFAKNSSDKRLIIVEGYMDVISLHQGGIINSVASLGTALTESQGRLLKKYAEEIIISYDADTAGQAATMRGLDLLNDVGCNVKVLIIPDGKDPDEFIRKNGPEELKKLIDKSISLIEYKIKVLRGQMNVESTEDKINFINKIAGILAKVDNRVEIEMYAKKFAREYEISSESILAEIYRRNKPKASFKNAVIDFKGLKGDNRKQQDGKDREIVHDERMLIALLCIDNKLYRLIRDKIFPADFVDEGNRKIYEIVMERLENNKDMVPAELLSILKGEDADNFARIMQMECNCEDNNKAVLDIIKRMEIYKLDQRKQQILDSLNNRDGLEKGDVEKLTLELNSIIIKRKNIK